MIRKINEKLEKRILLKKADLDLSGIMDNTGILGLDSRFFNSADFDFLLNIVTLLKYA